MKADDVELEERGRAYEELLQAGDRVKLTPGEIREIAAALRDLPRGQSFRIAVISSEAAYTRSVAVEY